MVDVLRVRPKPGCLFPRAAPLGGFVGYELATGETRDGDHVIPNGPRYRLKNEPESVPSTTYYRRAIAREDLEVALPEDDEPPAQDAPHSDEDSDPDAHESEG